MAWILTPRRPEGELTSRSLETCSCRKGTNNPLPVERNHTWVFLQVKLRCPFIDRAMVVHIALHGRGFGLGKV